MRVLATIAAGRFVGLLIVLGCFAAGAFLGVIALGFILVALAGGAFITWASRCAERQAARDRMERDRESRHP